jgi:hypothetical protein
LKNPSKKYSAEASTSAAAHAARRASASEAASGAARVRTRVGSGRALEAAGKWAEHELVQEKVRAEANAVLTASESASHRDPRLARRVHDSLLSTLVTVDCAPNRPGCLRKLKTPDSQSPCECGVVGCLKDVLLIRFGFVEYR